MSGEVGWNIVFLQVQIHRVLSSLHKWNSKLNTDKRIGKNIYYKKRFRVFSHIWTYWKFLGTLHYLHIRYWFQDWKQRLQCELYTKKEVLNCLPPLLIKNILVFNLQFFHPILHHILICFMTFFKWEWDLYPTLIYRVLYGFFVKF